MISRERKRVGSSDRRTTRTYPFSFSPNPNFLNFSAVFEYLFLTVVSANLICSSDLYLFFLSLWVLSFVVKSDLRVYIDISSFSDLIELLFSFTFNSS